MTGGLILRPYCLGELFVGASDPILTRRTSCGPSWASPLLRTTPYEPWPPITATTSVPPPIPPQTAAAPLRLGQEARQLRKCSEASRATGAAAATPRLLPPLGAPVPVLVQIEELHAYKLLG